MGSLIPGGKTQAPAPQGLGSPRQEPSVKTTAIPSSQLSRMPPNISLGNSSWSPVLDFEEPRILQYSGFCYLVVESRSIYTPSLSCFMKHQCLKSYPPPAYSFPKWGLPLLSLLFVLKMIPVDFYAFFIPWHHYSDGLFNSQFFSSYL